MICEQERKKVIVAKQLHAAGTITEEIAMRAAAEYRAALLAHRRRTGRKFWVPSTRRLFHLTNEGTNW